MADVGASTGKTAAEVEAEQEAMLRARYGSLGKQIKKPSKIPGKGDQKYFDSADYNMQKEAAKKTGVKPNLEEIQSLPPKLEPSPMLTRRVSHMDSIGKVDE